MTPRTRFSTRVVAPAVVVGLLAFLLTVDLRAQDAASKLTEGRRSQLAAAVAERQRHTAELETSLGQLRAQLTRLAETGSTQLREIHSAVDRIEGASGTTDLTGPGIVVRLADASDAGQTTQNDNRIQDVDIQAVVNALWAAGAEAIAVNGQRLISTSAIRDAGGAVLVNFRVLTSPYSVSAIGDTGAMRKTFEASDIARRFHAWQQIYGLGFDVMTESRVQIAAYQGVLHFRYAQPIQQGK
ncbi:MAG: DUF881 domain-containing protein [Actinomycetota bacterium]